MTHNVVFRNIELTDHKLLVKWMTYISKSLKKIIGGFGGQW